MTTLDVLKFGLPADRFTRIVIHPAPEQDGKLLNALSPHTDQLEHA